MQVLCGLQVVFFLFNCQTPVYHYNTDNYWGQEEIPGLRLTSFFLIV